MSIHQTIPEEIFDARALPCEIKRPAVIQRCLGLPAGRAFVLLNQHDPAPLRGHLDASFPGCFRWELLSGADGGGVRIRVVKLRDLPRDRPAGVGDFACH
jgi:uncharacterized protein (DUF2249 family)